jgi:hypothetical protein
MSEQPSVDERTEYETTITTLHQQVEELVSIVNISGRLTTAPLRGWDIKIDFYEPGRFDGMMWMWTLQSPYGPVTSLMAAVEGHNPCMYPTFERALAAAATFCKRMQGDPDLRDRCLAAYGKFINENLRIYPIPPADIPVEPMAQNSDDVDS